MSGLYLSMKTFSLLSLQSQREIKALMFNEETFKEIEIETETEVFAVFTQKQANEYIKGLSETTRDLLKSALIDNDGFWCETVSVSLGYALTGGMWAGITKRTRTVTGIEGSYLIEWDSYDEERGDYKGRFQPETTETLRKAFNL